MDEKLKKDLYKDFKKIFSIDKDKEGEDEIIEPKIGYIDLANVMMVIPKKKSLKQFIVNTFDVNESKRPEILNYRISKEEIGKEISTIYSGDYLKLILEIVKHYDTVRFKMKQDYPLLVETEDFDFILAPRVEND